MKSRVNLCRRLRLSSNRLKNDTSGLAAVEFAMIVPLMLVMLFGTIDVSSGVAVDRKVTLVARTLSDLTSQSSSVTDADLVNFSAAGAAIMAPYGTNVATPVNATISEIYIDPKTHKAKVIWSKGPSPHDAGENVEVPGGLATDGAYLIWSEVSYLYTPIAGYMMGSITLSDQTYTRPRQTQCVLYNPKTASDPCPT